VAKQAGSKAVIQGIGGKVDGQHTGAKSSNVNNVIIAQEACKDSSIDSILKKQSWNLKPL
jgi:hypothetical protein